MYLIPFNMSDIGRVEKRDSLRCSQCNYTAACNGLTQLKLSDNDSE